MALVSLQNLSFDYGREPILAGASLNILPGVRYALVGGNGAGKSTLLSLIAGEIEPLDGVRQLSGDAEIRFLRQETTFAPDSGAGSLFDVAAETAFAREQEIEAEMAEIASHLAAADSGRADELAARQGRLQAEYERRDGYGWRARLEAALSGLGLSDAVWNRRPEDLSGGERRRGALAATLLAGGDPLLLDEPTNHLDVDAREWLEIFLARRKGSAVIVSHDRHFLDRVATATIRIESGRLNGYKGNYSAFLAAMRERDARLRAEARRRGESRVRTEDFIRRNLAGQKTRQAQSRRRRLEKEEPIQAPPRERRAGGLRLEQERASGEYVIEIENLAKSFGGEPLFSDFSLLVLRGQRIGVLGPNGCGKTTLLNLIAGRETPDRGLVRIGHNVDVGCYDQHLRNVSDANTVLEEMQSVSPGATLGELRGFLAAFGFGADMIDRPVSRLSGGERGRLSLLRLIREGHNTLLLDEPTNHLDLAAREALEEALLDFPGTVVMVTHDRRFLDRTADRLVVFPGPKDDRREIRVHQGNWRDYCRWRDERRAATETGAGEGARRRPPRPRPVAERVPRRETAAGRGLSKNEIERRRRRIAEAEDRIAELEAEQAATLAAMSDPGTDSRRRTGLAERSEELVREIEEVMSRWEQWSDEIESAD